MNRRTVKMVNFTLAALLLSVAVFWILSLPAGDPFQTARLVAQIISGIIWAAFMAYTLALVENYMARGALAALIPLIVIYVGGADIWSVGAALLLGLSILAAAAAIRQEVADRITFRLKRIFYPGTRLLLFGLIIAVTGIRLASLTSELQQGALQIPEEYIRTINQRLEPALANLVPTFNADKTIEQIVEERSLVTAGRPLTEEESAALQRQLSQYFGTEVAPQENITGLVGTTINQQLKKVSNQYPFLAALIVLITILLTTRLILPLLTWPALGVLAILHRILQRLGVTYVLRSNETVERLQL